MRRIKTYLKLLRRRFSRGRWLSSVLQMPVSEGAADRPGLILIQVDGLSRARMEKGLATGRLPFLQRLMKQRDYQLYTHYSGLPSSTPAVQAELFYGIKTKVPAFGFLNRATGRMERMFEPGAAARVEQELQEQSSGGLLAGGSSYSNTFTGGADANEAHFCASSLGFREVLSAFKPLDFVVTVVVNGMSIVRLIGLLMLEVLLAFWDFFHGIYQGRSFLRELKFVPMRIAISVTLREICVMGAKMDISRGLPIIHMNFLGYDEQSHRRGPDSRFAMWTLKGIDYAVKRVWRDAARAEGRRYDVWIYSDHGQCSTTPYHRISGYSLEEAVRTTLDQLGISDGEAPPGAGTFASIPAHYDATADLFRRQPTCMCAAHRERDLPAAEPPDVVAGPRVAGLGPVAFVYFSAAMTAQQLTAIAQQLIRVHQVPCVLQANPDGTATAFTSETAYALPAQVNALCGENHPFSDCVAEDLLQLCFHPDAGDLTLLGWTAGTPQLTFASENGSHGGIATAETTAFALLPPKTEVAGIDKPFIRPTDIRNAALAHLGRLKKKSTLTTPLPKREANAQTLRILTYNVHSCIGTDGRLSTDRIARLIAEQAPHIVALQEVDVGRSRTGGHDQARQIARWLEMGYYFHPSLHVAEEQYGNVILTHLPMQLVKAGPLPGTSGNPSREPRGALWVAIEYDGQEIQVINTHLGLSPNERQQQVDCLMGSDWLGNALKSPHSTAPVIVCGDFNALPSSRPIRQLRTRLQDVQELLGDRTPLATFHSFFPAARIDHIFINGLQVDAVRVPRSLLARTASDHLPLVADLGLREAATQQ